MNPRKSLKRYAWLIMAWSLFAIIVAGWLIYWNIVASTAEARLAGWVAQQNAGGAHAAYQHVSRHGFPVLMRLQIDGVSYAPAHGDWRAETARADLNIEMLNTQHVIVQPRSQIALLRGDTVIAAISAETLLLSVRMENGALAVAGVEADKLRLEDRSQSRVLGAAKLVANLRPDPRLAGDYQLALRADGVTLPSPVRGLEAFGLNIPVLQADIVIEQAALLWQGGQDDPLEAWRAGAGKLRFEALGLNWGPLQTIGAGAASLDRARRLTGELSLPIAAPAPVFNALAEGPSLSASARRALKLLGTGYALNQRQLLLHVAAHDGVLSIEGLPLRTLAPAY